MSRVLRHARGRRRAYLLAGLACLATTFVALTTALAAGTADLGVSQTDDPDPVQTGELLVFSTTLANQGPDAAPRVRLVDKLASNVDFVGVNSPQGDCTQQARRVLCEFGELASGASSTVVVRVRPTKEGHVTNTVTVRSGATDPRPENNSETDRTTVDNPEPTICAKRNATIVGTDGDDTLTGTDGNDVIAGLSGNDAIVSGGGNDVVCGSGGDDAIKGKRGDDEVRGGGGNDAIKGGDGGDVVQGKGGDDALRGGRGADLIKGGGGSDTCSGGSGKDSLHSC